MPKQLNVNLAFTADTAKASQGLKALQQQLTQLMNTAATNSSSLGLTKDIKEATTAAAQLKAQLSSAMNANGTLDLTKFNDSLKASGMTLEQYRAKLSALGPEGTQAFSALASQISSAEIPLRRANTLLQEMGTTLMNTARWQLSSSLLHGFIGGLQHAYGYAQDLNESLNNIRIVTGQSTEQMAQLAQKANQAARELSTRTTDYTNASLIYYQQGLDDKAVEARTRTTLKLANVTRQSAEEVSNQMTAIWNNFDDGTKSLEYYADAITALGAKTASSSSEIAEGLSKFAAVADTIGLSYETATAALATVVAETRQSADTVGNAFKSIFSRLQSLKLGETLEDGVGLTKYSQALEKVGVQVLDINGELREADDIMSDLGDRWTKISDTQKTALAQTVAGQRQYAQFVALFDNWSKVQDNIGIAEGSEGTLQKQADIYAESWEASAKRVQASAEAIYQSLIDDKFFIGFNDLISGILDRVNDLIKGLGGIPGVLTTIGALFSKIFSSQIASNIDRITKNLTGASVKGAQQQQRDAIAALQKEASQAEAKGSMQGQAQAEGLRAQAELQETLIRNQGRYNEEQIKTAQNILDSNRNLQETVKITGELADKAKAQANLSQKNEFDRAQRYAKLNGISISAQETQDLQTAINDFRTITEVIPEVESHFNSFYQVLGDGKKTTEQKMSEMKEIITANMGQIKVSLKAGGIDDFRIGMFEKIAEGAADGRISLNFFQQTLDKLFLDIQKNSQNSGDNLAKQFFNFYQDAGLASDAVDRLQKEFGLSGDAAAKLKEEIQALANSAKNGKDAMNEMKTAGATFGQQLQATASFAMSFASVINSVKSAIETLNNEDLSFGEKMLQIIPALLMSFGMLTSAMSGASGAALITAASHIPLIGSFASEAVAANLATASTATFGVTLQAVFPVLGIVAAGILAIGAALKYWDNTHYSFAEQMEDAKAATEHAAEAAEHAKTKYEEISSAVDQYQSVIDTLDSCTVGTDAWREALEKVGEVTQDLIDQYPELLDYYDSTTGKLNLEEMQEYLELLEQQKLATSLQNIYAPAREERIKQQNAEDVWDKVQGDFQQQNADLASVSGGNIKFGNENPVLSYLEQMQEDAMQKISSGESTEKAWDVASQNGQKYQLSLTSKEYTDLFNNAIQGLQDSGIEITRDNYLEELTKQFKKDPDLVNQINGIIKGELENLEYLNENDEYVENFSVDLLNKMNPDAHQAIFDSLLESIISNFTTQSNYFIESTEAAQSYKGTLDTAMSRIVNARLSSLADESTYDSLTKALVEKTLKDTIQKQSEYIDENKQKNFDEQYKGKMDFTGQTVSLRAQDAYYMKGTKGANGNDYEAWQKGFTDAYLQASGLSNLQYSHVEGNNDEDRKYVFKDTENEGKEVSIDVEEMSSIIALYENGVVNFTDILDKAGQKVDEVFGSDLPDDLKDALGKGFKEGKFSFSDVAKESLDAIFTDGKASSLTDRIIESLGLKDASLEDINNKFLELFDISYTDLLNGLSSGLHEFNQGIKSLGQDIKSESTRESFNSILGNLEGTSLNTQAAAKDQLKAAYVNGGDEAAQALADLYTMAGNKAALLTELDFSSFDSIEDFKESLEEVGLESLTSSEGLDLVFNSLKSLEQPSQTASQRIAEINKITGSLSKGNTISEEDYSILGAEITEGFFRKVADGTYELIKDADEFQSHIDKISLEKLGEEIRNRNAAEKNITERYESSDQIKEYADSSYKVDKSGKYIAGSQDSNVLREQINFLAEIGKLTDEQIWELGQDLDHNQKLSLDNLELVHGLMLEVANDWDSINQKVENNEQLTKDDVTQLLSLTPNLESLEKFYNNNKDLFEDIDFSKLNIEGIDLEGLDGFEALAKIFVEGGFVDTSGIKTLDEYKKALKGIGEEAGLTAEQAKEAWKNIDPSTLSISDLSYVRQEFKENRMEIEQYKAIIDSLSSKISSLPELHLMSSDLNPEQYSKALDNVLSKNNTGTLDALEEIDRAILNGKADAELMGSVLDRITGASDLTSKEKAAEIDRENQLTHEETRVSDNGTNQYTYQAQNISDKDAGMAKMDIAANATDMFDTDRLEMFNQGLEKIRNTANLTATDVAKIGAAATSIYKGSDFFNIQQQIKGIKDAFKVGGEENFQANLKGYADAIKDIILETKDLDLDEKMALVKSELEEAGVPLEYINKELVDLIVNSEDLTLKEKLDQMKESGLDLNEALEATNALIKEILGNEQTSTIDKVRELLDLLKLNGNPEEVASGIADTIASDKTMDVMQKQQAFNTKAGLGEAPKLSDFKNYALAENPEEDIQSYTKAVAEYNKEFTAYREGYEEFIRNLSGSEFGSLSDIFAFEEKLPEDLKEVFNEEKAIVDYASQFASAKDYIEDYNDAILRNEEGLAELEQIKLVAFSEDSAAEHDLEAESVLNLAQTYLQLAEAEDSAYKDLKDNERGAVELAEATLRRARGEESLSKNISKNTAFMKEYTSIWEKFGKEQGKIAADTYAAQASNSKVAQQMKKDLADIFNINDKLMNKNWAKLQLKDFQNIEKAVGGNAEAFEEVQRTLLELTGKEYNINVNTEVIDELMEFNEKHPEGFHIDIEADGIQELPSYLQEAISKYENLEMSQEELNSILGEAGWAADFAENVGDAVDTAKEKVGELPEAVGEASAESGAAMESGLVDAADNIEVSAETDVAEGTGESEQMGFDEQVRVEQIPGIATIMEDGMKHPITFHTTQPEYHSSVTPVPVPQEVKTEQPLVAPKVAGLTRTGGGNIKAPSGGGGGGGRGCFAAGTLITIGNKYKNIEDIKIGDIVLSYNEKLRRNEYSVVLQTMIHNVFDNIYTLYIGDEKLVVTGIHKFLIQDGIYSRWIAAENLQVGDLVLLASGQLHTIDKIDIELKAEIVYNFEVSNNHNYYVGKNQILAHNKGGGRSPRAARQAATKTTTKKAGAEHVTSKERFNPLTQEIQKLSDAYTAANSSKDHLFGKKHLDAIDKEIAATKQLIDAQRRYKEEADKWKNEDVANTQNRSTSESTIIKMKKDGTYSNKLQNANVKKSKKGWQQIKYTSAGQSQAANDTNASYSFSKSKINEKSNKVSTTESTKFVSADVLSATGTDQKIKIDKGYLENYNDLVEAADKKLNDTADWFAKNYDQNLKYNGQKGKKSNAKAVLKNEAIKNEYEKQKAIHDQFVANLKRIEEDLKTQREAITQQIEYEIQALQQHIEKATYTVDIKLELDDTKLEVINFALERMSSTGREASKRISKLGETLGIAADKYQLHEERIQNVLHTIAKDQYSKGITDNAGTEQRFNDYNLIDTSGAGDNAYLDGKKLLEDLQSQNADIRKAAIETLSKSQTIKKDQLDNVIDDAKQELTELQNLRNNFLGMYDEMAQSINYWNNQMDLTIEKQQQLNNLINGYKNVVDLVGKTQFYQDRAKGRELEAKIDENLKTTNNNTYKMYQIQAKQAEDTLNKLQNQKNAAYQNMNDSSLTEEARKEWSSVYDKYESMVEEQQSVYNTAIQNSQAAFETALQTNLDAWIREMERAADEFQESMAGTATSLDYLAEALDRYERTHSTIVPEYEKVHQLRMMDLEAEKSINEATDPKIKRDLLKIQDEITAATAKDAEMSEYELTYLRQKLELKQAEAALEDAQKAKTQVSLTRDNEGNFGYVYTADDSDVADAEKTYADKIYEMQKANAEYIQDLQTQFVQAEQEYYQKMQEIASDNNLTEADRRAKMTRINEDYNDLHMALTDQFRNALTASHDIYGEYSDRYAEITGDLTATNLAHVESWADTRLKVETEIESLQEYQDNWANAVSGENGYFAQMIASLSNYAKANEETLGAGGAQKTMAEYAGAVQTDLDNTKTKTDELSSSMSNLATTASQKFTEVSKSVQDFEKTYVGKMGTMITATQTLIDSLVTAQTELLSFTETANQKNGPGGPAGIVGGAQPGKSPKYVGNKKSKKQPKTLTNNSQIKKLKSNHVKYMKAYKDVVKAQKSTKKYKNATRAQRAKMDRKIITNATKAAKKKLRQMLASGQYSKVILRYDTGGYTGDWNNNDGKLAMLHKKELVLNQEDTKNILSTVGMIRDIANKVDLNALASSGAFSSLGAAGVGSLNNGLEQHVSIEANFPNATSREEIQAAFENLIGLASQYANRP